MLLYKSKIAKALMLATGILVTGAAVHFQAPGLAQIHAQEKKPEPAAALQVELEDKFAAIDREVVRLRKAGKTDDADRLAGQLAHLRDRLAGKAAATSKEPELHVVGLYEGAYPDGVGHRGNIHPQGTATVEVSVTDRPIILVLCSYEPVKWRLQIGKDVKLQKVILGGYYEQEAADVPKDVPVEKHTCLGGSRKVFFAYEKDEDYYPMVASGLKKLTGADIATFQGTYAYKQQPFIVGPNDRDWQAQRVLADLGPLYQAATAYERAQRREAMQAIRFRAMYLSRVDERELKSTFAEFTPSGPIAQTLQPLPPAIKHVAVDPKGPTYYGIVSHSVVRLDIQSGKTTELGIGEKLPKLSWPCGLTFDTKRRRLVLTSLGGVGHMYAYEPDANKWSLLGDMDNVDVQSFTYAAEADCYYGLAMNHGEKKQEILEYTAEGKLQRRFPVEAPMPATREGNAQLIAVGQQLALLTPPVADLATPDLRPQSRCYLIDPQKGKVMYTEVLQPHAGKQKFAAKELEALWQSLRGADQAEADKVMWQMAAGQKDTVAFLREQIKPIQVPDAKRIATLIAELNDDQFRVREEAFRELQRLGSLVEPELQKALESTASAEVRGRVRRLLEPISKGQSNDPEVQREQRAIHVLTRIGTPEAVEYLRELAAGPKGANRTKAAVAALQQIGQQR